MTPLRRLLILLVIALLTVLIDAPLPTTAQSDGCADDFARAVALLESAKEEAAKGLTRISLEAVEAAQKVLADILTRCGAQGVGALTEQVRLDNGLTINYPEGWTSLELRTNQLQAKAMAFSSAGPGLALLVYQPSTDRELREIYLVVGSENAVMRELMGALAPIQLLRDPAEMVTFMTEQLDARRNSGTAWRFGEVKRTNAGSYVAGVAPVTTPTYKGVFAVVALDEVRYAFALSGAASGTSEAMEALTLSMLSTIRGQ